MSNNYFQFKQFIIWQDKSSMKVGTDGCLLGAWAPLDSASKVLDVGSGTGLVSLMIAQRLSELHTDFHIDAIEIDDSSYEQSIDNIQSSTWRENVTIIHGDFLDFQGSDYDLVVCNPPFYRNALSCPDYSRNLARNEEVLPFDLLLENVERCLSIYGKFVVILPFDSMDVFEMLAKEKRLFVQKVLYVYSTARKSCKRVILVLSKNNTIVKTDESLVIQENGGFTEDYLNLMKDFYLNL